MNTAIALYNGVSAPDSCMVFFATMSIVLIVCLVILGYRVIAVHRQMRDRI